MPLARISFWRSIFLGAINALIFSVVLFLAEKIVGYSGWPRVSYAWVSTAVLLILCFAPTSYLMHRLFARRTRSQLFLWVATGIVAVCVWNGLFAAAAYSELREHNYTVLYYEITNPRNPQFGLFSLALVVVTNLIFATAIKALTERRANPARPA
jgi:hypothetical protein